MAETRTKEELIRLAWLTELRRQGHRQCVGSYSVWNRVCALGLLAEVAGKDDPASLVLIGGPRRIVEWAGMPSWTGEIIVKMNDRGHTFAEIADVVAGWFKE